MKKEAKEEIENLIEEIRKQPQNSEITSLIEKIKKNFEEDEAFKKELASQMPKEFIVLETLLKEKNFNKDIWQASLVSAMKIIIVLKSMLEDDEIPVLSKDFLFIMRRLNNLAHEVKTAALEEKIPCGYLAGYFVSDCHHLLHRVGKKNDEQIRKAMSC